MNVATTVTAVAQILEANSAKNSTGWRSPPGEGLINEPLNFSKFVGGLRLGSVQVGNQQIDSGFAGLRTPQPSPLDIFMKSRANSIGN